MTDAARKTERDALVDRIHRISHERTPIPTGVEPRPPRLEGVRAVLLDVYGTLLISGSGEVGMADIQSEVAPAQEGAEAERATAPREDSAAAALAAAFRVADVRGAEEGAAARGVALLPRHIRSFHEMLRRRGAAYPEVDIRTIWSDVLHELGEEGWIVDDLDPPRIERLAVEYECRVNPCWPMPGAADLLRSITRSGLAMGIVSNAQFFTPLTLQALLGASVVSLGFREDLCAWSFNHLRAKPDEAMYRRVLNRLDAHDGIEPNQVLYVGNDIRNDIKPAAALGCRTALFAGDQRSLRMREGEPECEGVRPDAIIDRLNLISGSVR